MAIKKMPCRTCCPPILETKAYCGVEITTEWLRLGDIDDERASKFHRSNLKHDPGHLACEDCDGYGCEFKCDYPNANLETGDWGKKVWNIFPCEECKGLGYVICPECNGKGTAYYDEPEPEPDIEESETEGVYYLSNTQNLGDCPYCGIHGEPRHRCEDCRKVFCEGCTAEHIPRMFRSDDYKCPNCGSLNTTPL